MLLKFRVWNSLHKYTVLTPHPTMEWLSARRWNLLLLIVMKLSLQTFPPPAPAGAFANYSAGISAALPTCAHASATVRVGRQFRCRDNSHIIYRRPISIRPTVRARQLLLTKVRLLLIEWYAQYYLGFSHLVCRPYCLASPTPPLSVAFQSAVPIPRLAAIIR